MAKRQSLSQDFLSPSHPQDSCREGTDLVSIRVTIQLDRFCSSSQDDLLRGGRDEVVRSKMEQNQSSTSLPSS